MFRDSGVKRKRTDILYDESYYDIKLNRVCIHCGYRYGKHMGKICPIEIDNKSCLII